jgi:hypothetical protein
MYRVACIRWSLVVGCARRRHQTQLVHLSQAEASTRAWTRGLWWDRDPLNKAGRGERESESAPVGS